MGSGCSPEIDDIGLPHMSAGSAPALSVSRPIRRLLTLRPACSRSRQATLSIEGFGSFVTSATAPIATGWSNSCQVGLTPTEERRLCTAHGHSSILLRVKQTSPNPKAAPALDRTDVLDTQVHNHVRGIPAPTGDNWCRFIISRKRKGIIGDNWCRIIISRKRKRHQ